MKWIIGLIILYKTLHVENMEVPPMQNFIEEEFDPKSMVSSEEEDSADDYLIAIKDEDDDKEQNDAEETENPNKGDNNKKPCAIMVLSNNQVPTSQTLIRRYRYDQKGLLIMNSVKYFIKIPQPQSPPVYVPLNDKAFSPLGGFIRFYKQVPPIPQAW